MSFNIIGSIGKILPKSNKMRGIKIIILGIITLVCAFFLSNSNLSFAAESKWGTYGSDPITILGEVKDKANGKNSNYTIHDTALDGVNDQQGTYSKEYKIANTLVYIKDHMHRYLQRLMYVGLAIAVILIIYQGFLMVTNAIHKQGELSKIKENLVKILIGVLLMTGFYYFIQLVLSLIVMIFGES